MLYCLCCWLRFPYLCRSHEKNLRDSKFIVLLQINIKEQRPSYDYFQFNIQLWVFVPRHTHTNKKNNIFIFHFPIDFQLQTQSSQNDFLFPFLPSQLCNLSCANRN
jgi:hypothetical protein